MIWLRKRVVETTFGDSIICLVLDGKAREGTYPGSVFTNTGNQECRFFDWYRLNYRFQRYCQFWLANETHNEEEN